MARNKESKEAQILNWFATADLGAANMLLGLVKSVVGKRGPVAAPRPQVVPARKPKTAAAAAAAAPAPSESPAVEANTESASA